MMKQNGFTLLAVLFVMILMSLVGVYMLKLGNYQQANINFVWLNHQADSALQNAMVIAKNEFEADQKCKNDAYQWQGFQVQVYCSVISQHSNDVRLQIKVHKNRLGERDYVAKEIEVGLGLLPNSA